MRPYNTYRSSELSQSVSSVENTLADRTSNSSFDILRSLSESISVDCGSFEISEPREYYQTSSVPNHDASVVSGGKEIRTSVESAPAAPVKSEPAKVMQTPDRVGSQVEDGSAENSSFGNKTLSSCPRGFAPVKPSVNPASDMDDDNYDCMNDPNYRTQCVKEADSPSFEELMARTAEGIARMREETRAVYSDSEKDEMQGKHSVAEKSESRSKNRTECVENAPKADTKSSTEKPSTKKGFLSSINWDKTRKLLFSREAIKLAFLSIAVSALIVSAVIYRNTSRSNNGLPESDDVAMNQSASEIQDVPVQGENELNGSSNADYAWSPQNNDSWASSDNSNPRALTDQMRGDYQSPTFDADPSGFEYSQNGTDGYLTPEDAGRPLAPPHSTNNGETQFVDAIPAYNPGSQYAEVAPAIGAQYSPDEYESPVLEDDTVSGYSETGYNSNFMR